MFIDQEIVADQLSPASCLDLTLSQVRDRIVRDAFRRFELGRRQPDRDGSWKCQQHHLRRFGFLDTKGHRTQLAREACAQPGRKYGEALVWAYGFNVPCIPIGQIAREVIEAAFGSADGLTDDVVQIAPGKVAA